MFLIDVFQNSDKYSQASSMLELWDLQQGAFKWVSAPEISVWNWKECEGKYMQAFMDWFGSEMHHFWPPVFVAVDPLPHIYMVGW